MTLTERERHAGWISRGNPDELLAEVDGGITVGTAPRGHWQGHSHSRGSRRPQLRHRRSLVEHAQKAERGLQPA